MGLFLLRKSLPFWESVGVWSSWVEWRELWGGMRFGGGGQRREGSWKGRKGDDGRGRVEGSGWMWRARVED
jgi:hypothetical protein